MMNAHQKFSLALNTSKKIANTLSMLSDGNFKRKLEQLKVLNDMWSAGKEIGFQELGDPVVDDTDPGLIGESTPSNDEDD